MLRNTLLVAVATLPLLASAQANQCLQQASSSELLSEVSRRMGGTGSVTDSRPNRWVLRAVCDGNIAFLTVLNVSDGKEKIHRYSMDSSGDCQDSVREISAKTSTSAFAGHPKIALCIEARLLSFTFPIYGEIVRAVTVAPSPMACAQEASKINKM